MSAWLQLRAVSGKVFKFLTTNKRCYEIIRAGKILALHAVIIFQSTVHTFNEVESMDS